MPPPAATGEDVHSINNQLLQKEDWRDSFIILAYPAEKIKKEVREMPKYTKRKDGRYQTKIYLGLDESNKKKYKYLYASSEK